MGFFDSLTEIVLSPVSAAAEVIRDVSGDNGESDGLAAIATLGVSSIVKGTAKSIVRAADKINK